MPGGGLIFNRGPPGSPGTFPGAVPGFFGNRSAVGKERIRREGAGIGPWAAAAGICGPGDVQGHRGHGKTGKERGGIEGEGIGNVWNVGKKRPQLCLSSTSATPELLNPQNSLNPWNS